MSDQTVTSLAVLTVNWNRGHDVIESFVPLVAECIRRNGDRPVALVELQEAVARESGIKIPSGALQAILGRCARRGLVRLENRVYLPDRQKLDELNYAPVRAEAVRQHGCLLDKLRGFAREQYSQDWSAEQADEHLLGWLQEGSLPVLVAATEGDPVPFSQQASRRTKHVLNSFAAHVWESDPEGADCLVTVVKGYILSGVLFYPDLGQFETHFEELDIYCDTPFLLRALGYSEEGLHIQCLDLVELLRELGANLKCFHHTREEVVGVLEAEAARLRPGMTSSNGPVEYSTSRSFRMNEVEEMIVKIDDTLGSLGIEVVDTPSWTQEPEEGALDEEIRRHITYSRDRAREKDVKSLAAVARLRGLRRMDRFERAKAIFVTTNMSLSRASSVFFRDIEGRGAIPVCMPVEMMTRLAWVKKPMAAPELPKHMTMAASYAALNPPTPLWREYLTEIAHRREQGELSDTEYHFLRSSQEARRALMDETFGDEGAFSAGTVDEVLAHAKAAFQAEALATAEAERRGREEAEEAAQAALRRAEGIEEAHRGVVARRGRRRGAAVGWGMAAVVSVAFLVGVFATIPGFPLIEVKGGWRYLIWASLAIFGLVNVGTAVRGTTIFGMRRAVSARVERWLCERGQQRLDELHARATKNEHD